MLPSPRSCLQESYTRPENVAITKVMLTGELHTTRECCHHQVMLIGELHTARECCHHQGHAYRRATHGQRMLPSPRSCLQESYTRPENVAITKVMLIGELHTARECCHHQGHAYRRATHGQRMLPSPRSCLQESYTRPENVAITKVMLTGELHTARECCHHQGHAYRRATHGQRMLPSPRSCLQESYTRPENVTITKVMLTGELHTARECCHHQGHAYRRATHGQRMLLSTSKVMLTGELHTARECYHHQGHAYRRATHGQRMLPSPRSCLQESYTRPENVAKYLQGHAYRRATRGQECCGFLPTLQLGKQLINTSGKTHKITPWFKNFECNCC